MSAVSWLDFQTSSAWSSGRVVLAERCLDAALRLGRVARLERPLRRDGDAGAGPLGRHGRGEPGGPASDHEHLEREPLAHDGEDVGQLCLMLGISTAYL